jgi:hypothetical protein
MAWNCLIDGNFKGCGNTLDYIDFQIHTCFMPYYVFNLLKIYSVKKLIVCLNKAYQLVKF